MFLANWVRWLCPELISTEIKTCLKVSKFIMKYIYICMLLKMFWNNFLSFANVTIINPSQYAINQIQKSHSDPTELCCSHLLFLNILDLRIMSDGQRFDTSSSKTCLASLPTHPRGHLYLFIPGGRFYHHQIWCIYQCPSAWDRKSIKSQAANWILCSYYRNEPKMA